MLFIILVSSGAVGKEVPISSLPNAGTMPLAEAKKAASMFATSLQRALPAKYLSMREITEVGFLPYNNEIFFTVVEKGASREEELYAIQQLSAMESEKEGSVSKFQSEQYI